MPGIDHELQVLLLQNRPDIPAEILRTTFGMEIPDYDHAETGCADLTSFDLKENKADQVSVLLGADGRRIMAVINEVQTQPDDEKAYSWPLYTAVARERLRCPVHLLVLCPDQRTADWARKPIGERGESLGFQASGLGPDNMPVIDDPARAQRLPELSVLSTAFHGKNPAVLEAAQAALDAVPGNRLERYYDCIWSKLSDSTRRIWEALMQAQQYEWQGAYRRKIEEGEAAGRAAGEAKAIIKLLRSRGIVLSDDQRETIETCTDIDQLDTWFDRALKADTARDLFA